MPPCKLLALLYLVETVARPRNPRHGAWTGHWALVLCKRLLEHSPITGSYTWSWRICLLANKTKLLRLYHGGLKRQHAFADPHILEEAMSGSLWVCLGCGFRWGKSGVAMMGHLLFISSTNAFAYTSQVFSASAFNTV